MSTRAGSRHAEPADASGNRASQSLEDSTGLLALFADATRLRLLALLEEDELSVAELTAITELGQSRVSTHLGKLYRAGLLHDRKSGASTLYRMHAAMPAPAASLWSHLREQIDDALLSGDRARREALRRGVGELGAWPASIAGEMERHYSPGRTWPAVVHGLCAMLRLGDVLDIGCGDGWSGTLLAPRARSYVGLDRSARVVEAATARLSTVAHATVVHGEMESLPFSEALFDTVVCFHVLPHAESPAAALAQVARVLRPGGRLVLTTLAAHDRLDTTAAYGHRHAGFSPGALSQALAQAGLAALECGVTSRERKSPHFEVVTAIAERVVD